LKMLGWELMIIDTIDLSGEALISQFDLSIHRSTGHELISQDFTAREQISCPSHSYNHIPST
jgi:hypothetical protein